MNAENNDLMSVAEVAHAKGVSVQAMYTAIRVGRLAGGRIGHLHVIRRADAAAWQVVGHRPRKRTREGG